MKSYVSVASPNRKGIITDGLTAIFKNNIPRPKTLDIISLMFGEVKYQKETKNLSYAEFYDGNGEKYCQSCGLPIGATDEMYGTESDGSKSSDYCKYCYENGQFTTNVTMDEMIETCVPHMASANTGISEDEARNMMKEWFPTLKRWK